MHPGCMHASGAGRSGDRVAAVGVWDPLGPCGKRGACFPTEVPFVFSETWLAFVGLSAGFVGVVVYHSIGLWEPQQALPVEFHKCSIAKTDLWRI